jgi:hypothetical protein
MKPFSGILGSITTRQLQEFEPSSLHKRAIGRDDLIDLGLFAAQQWERKHAELLSVFDLAGLRETMSAFTELEADGGAIEQAMRDDVNPDMAILKACELAYSRAFITLYDRGALNRLLVVDEIPASAQAQLDQMAREVESAGPAPVVQSVAAPVVVEDPISRCVRDWHELGSDAFRKKYISDTRNRKFYETAIDRGLL